MRTARLAPSICMYACTAHAVVRASEPLVSDRDARTFSESPTIVSAARAATLGRRGEE
jgi:hypothetical protein